MLREIAARARSLWRGVRHRDRLSPAAADVRRMLDEATQRARETEAALRTLLEPVATSVTAIQVRLADLAGDAWPVETSEDDPAVAVGEPAVEDGGSAPAVGEPADAIVTAEADEPTVSAVPDIDDAGMTEDIEGQDAGAEDDQARDISLIRVEDDDAIRRLRW